MSPVQSQERFVTHFEIKTILNSNLIVVFQYGQIGDSPKKAFVVNSK